MGLLDRIRRTPAEAPEADAAPPAEDAPERRRITRPRGYRDTPAARARLAEVLAEQVEGGPWHVVAVDNGTLTITDDPEDPWIARPRARTVTLTADGVRSERSIGRAIELLAERGLGTAVAVSAERRRIVTADLTPAHAAVRATVAHVLGVAPHAVEVTPTWASDDAHGGHLATVTVRGARSLVRDPEKRARAWLEVVGALPDGHDGWEVHDEGEAVTLTWAPPEALPETITLEAVAALDSATDARLPLGIRPDGTAATWDSALSPHLLIAGGTGAGKSVAISAVYAAALSRGWQVVVGEAQKRGADYMPARGRFGRLETTVEGAAELVASVYAEMERRGALMVEHGVQKLAELPARVRPAPILLIVDEWQGLIREQRIAKGMPEALKSAAEADNAHRGSILFWTGKLLAEARSAEIHVLIATQEPSVDSLGGSALRAQLTTRLQMVPPATGLSRIQAGYAFPDTDDQDDALAYVQRLGGRPGLGLAKGETGRVMALRAPYATLPAVSEWLDAQGIATPERLPHAVPEMMRTAGGGDSESSPSGGARGRGGGLDDALDAL